MSQPSSLLAQAYSHGRRSYRFALGLVALSAACSDGIGYEPQVIWLTPLRSANMTVGNTLTVTATIQGRSPCACRWGSSDAAVASVSSDGLVRAQAPGITTITATLALDPTVKNSVLVVVVEALSEHRDPLATVR